LRDVAINTKAAKDTLDGLATQIGDRIQQGITQAITESLDNSLKNLTEKLAASLHEGMQREQVSTIQNMLTELSAGLRQQLNTLTAEVAAVGGRLSAPLDQTTNRISGFLDQFADTTKRVGDIMEGTAARMDQGLQVIHAQSNIADRLAQTADRFAFASQSLDPFREALIVAADRNLEAAESQKMASSAQQSFLQSLITVTDKLSDLRATYENAALALKGIADPIQRLGGLVESLIANSKAGQEANEAAWNKATAALASSGEYIQGISAASKEINQAAQRFETLKMTLSTVGAQAAAAVSQIQKATEANERIAASLTAMSGQLPALAKGMENTRKETEKAQNDVGGLRELINGIKAMLATMGQERDKEETERLARLTGILNDAVERMRQAAEAFSTIDRINDALQKTVAGLMGATNNLQAYGTEIKQSAMAHRESAKHSLDAVQEYRETMELLTGLPDSIALASETLEKAGKVLQEGSTATNNTMREVLKGQNAWLAGTERGLIAMRDRLQEIIRAYGEQIEGQTNALMKQWSDEVTKALQSYGERVEELRELVESLQEQLEQQNEE
jgi:chromosome segregation ATPase